MKRSRIIMLSLLVLLLVLSPAALVAQDDTESDAPAATEDVTAGPTETEDTTSDDAVETSDGDMTEEATTEEVTETSEDTAETSEDSTDSDTTTEDTTETSEDTADSDTTEEDASAQDTTRSDDATTSTASSSGDDGDLVVYTVRPGDNLFRIALRYGTTVSAIAAENNINNVTVIYVGQQLRIPGTTATPTPPPDDGDGDGNLTTYTVVRGDTLSSIARRFGTTFTAIARENNLPDPNRIFAGQVLRIPGTSGGPTPTPVPTTPPDDDDGSTTTYTVVRGDTLSSIARRFGVSTTAIAQANGIVNPNLIFVGQVLTIPGADGGTPPPGGGDGDGDGDGGTPNLGDFELGGQVFSFAYPDLMRNTGMEWAKIQVRWERGQSASDVAQAAIDAARSRNFNVLLSIVGDPDELAENPTQYYQDFALFLGEVAALDPDAIEVWNEMNIDREWPAGQISGQNYTQMLSAAYQSIKNSNADVLVISGAPAPTGFFGACTTSGCDDNFFIRDMANAGASQFMDCVGVHYNEGVVPPTATSGDPRGNSSHYSRYYGGMVSLYANTFPNKPLCFTELGYLSPEGYSELPAGFTWASDTTVAEQAEYLASAVQLARNDSRVRMLIVWNVDSTLYGADPQAGYAIVRPDDTCPACNAIADVLN